MKNFIRYKRPLCFRLQFLRETHVSEKTHKHTKYRWPMPDARSPMTINFQLKNLQQTGTDIHHWHNAWAQSAPRTKCRNHVDDTKPIHPFPCNLFSSASLRHSSLSPSPFSFSRSAPVFQSRYFSRILRVSMPALTSIFSRCDLHI